LDFIRRKECRTKVLRLQGEFQDAHTANNNRTQDEDTDIDHFLQPQMQFGDVKCIYDIYEHVRVKVTAQASVRAVVKDSSWKLLS